MNKEVDLGFSTVVQCIPNNNEAVANLWNMRGLQIFIENEQCKKKMHGFQNILHVNKPIFNSIFHERLKFLCVIIAHCFHIFLKKGRTKSLLKISLNSWNSN